MGAGGPRRGAGPPDGGWGWAVLGACFVVTGFAYGFPKAVSVFFRALMRDFGAGYSDTAWVSSIMLAMLYGTGPVSSILVTRFGCRPVMLVGGLLASAGMVLASFATRLLELYLTAGVLTGRLVDALKNYEIIFYLAGSEVVLAGVFMAVATSCCLRHSRNPQPSQGTEGEASDTEDAEAEGDSGALPTGAEEPGSLKAREVPTPRAGPTEPEAEAEPGLDPKSV
ncbi:monocarboxylate transporter 3 isoform X1 [Mustela lutreola]|uniref:monocarboxylate transporter 3 isoform X1 n=1 Tax=Mustela lutreola TaxID=9666 RepID=UPI0027976834|nr:monocarboxylate transporter 3 isoform X1 [Mustela lutreola]